MCGLLGTHQGLHLLNLRILETQRMQSEDSMERECAERVSEWRCRLDAAAVMGVVVGALDPRGHPRLLLNHHQPPSTSSTSCYVSGPPNNHQPTPQPNKSALLYAAPHRLRFHANLLSVRPNMRAHQPSSSPPREKHIITNYTN